MDDFSNSTWTKGVEYLYIKGSNHFLPKKLGIICLIQSIPTAENKIICNIIGKVFFWLLKKTPLILICILDNTLYYVILRHINQLGLARLSNKICKFLCEFFTTPKSFF